MTLLEEFMAQLTSQMATQNEILRAQVHATSALRLEIRAASVARQDTYDDAAEDVRAAANNEAARAEARMQ